MGNVLYLNVTPKVGDPTIVPGRYAYQYNVSGELVQTSEGYDSGGSPIPVTTTEYAYDALGQLLGYSVNGTWTNYTYDPVGNRLTETSGGTTVTYTYSANDELLSTTDGSSYTYDDNGNMLTSAVGIDVRTHAYGYENEIVDTVYAGLCHRNYSGDGQMTVFSYTGSHGYLCTNLVYSHIPGLATVSVRTDVNSGDYTLFWFVPGTDEVLGLDYWDSYYGSFTYFTFVDGLGNTRHVAYALDLAADLSSQSYSPFGTMSSPVIYKYDQWTYIPSYQGRIYDYYTGCYDFRARQYDPAVGRFTERDPRQAIGVSAYVFVSNSPLVGRDPTGEWPVWNLYIPCWKGGWWPFGTLKFNWNIFFNKLATSVVVGIAAVTACVYALIFVCGSTIWAAIVATALGQFQFAGPLWSLAGYCALSACGTSLIWYIFSAALQSFRCT
jgi:RHS repeat-associated protein